MTYSITDLSKKVEYVNSYRRIYNDSHIDRLNAIECFKKALLPLDEIKLFFAYEKNMKANSEKIL